MKKRLWRCLTVGLVVLVLITGSLAAGADVSRRVVRVGFYPLNGLQNIGEDGTLSGYVYDYLQEIAKTTGWIYEYDICSFSDALKKLESGDLDLMGGVQMLEERKSRFSYGAYPCGEMYVALYALQNSTQFAYGDADSLQGIRVGVIRDLAANQDLAAYCADRQISLTTQAYPGEDEMLQALRAGEVDAICTISANARQGLRCIAAFGYKNFYMMTTRGNDELLEQLNLALERIKIQNPSYEQTLNNRYFPSRQDTKPVFTKEEKAYIESAEPLNVVYNRNWIPFERCNAQTGAFEGATADVFALIEKLSGLTFHYIPKDSFVEAYQTLKDGGAQLIASTAYDYLWAQQKGLLPSRQYLNLPVVRVSRTSDESGRSLVAMPAGLLMSEQLQERFPNDRYQTYPDFDACFDAVRTGEADATFANVYTAREYQKMAQYSDLEFTALSDSCERYCIGVSNKMDARLISVIDQSLACISDSQIDEFILADTLRATPLSIRHLIYQKPVESLIVAASATALFIVLLLMVILGKTRYTKHVYTLLNVDPLTGSASPAKFRKDAGRLLGDSKRQQLLLMYVNINKFKDINDLYGYDAGDRALKYLCESMKKHLQPGELMTRLHSDRFIALLTCPDDAMFGARCTAFLNDLRSGCDDSMLPFKLHLSIGAYFLGMRSENLDLSIDRARYANSQCVRQQYVIYDDELDKRIQMERVLESDMEQALINGEFQVYYQPKIDSRDEKVEGAEALIRWVHARLGMLTPAAFIPLFEKNAFITKIDYFVFREVCRYMATRRAEGETMIPISCNFSRLHLLNGRFADELCEIADAYQLEHALLNVEITETIAVEDLKTVDSQLCKLRALGFRVSIDDFGSGYSSLGILSQIAFDEVKLDRSLVVNAACSEANRMILSGIVSTIQSLHKIIVCEGVENQTQVDLLKSLNCYIIQGFYYAKPMSEAAFDQKYR